jgi:beta-lactamase regulating signal transducer with metallopeptidase domain
MIPAHWLTPALSWLADMLLFSSLILGSVWLVCRLRPRMAASRRHLLLTAALLAVPVLMAASWLFGMAGWLRPVPLTVNRLIISANNSPRLESWVMTPNPPKDPFAAVPANNRDPFRKPSFLIPAPGDARFLFERSVIVVWLAGVAGGLFLLMLALRQLALTRKTWALEDNARLLAVLEQIKGELGLPTTRVELRRGPPNAMPMTFGLPRPVVMLPESAGEWPESRLRMVLRHELAHVGRKDAWSRLAATLSALSLWFHPLVWLVWREQQRAMEHACDDLACEASGGRREDYAEQLLEAVAAVSAPAKRLLPGMSMASDARTLRSRVTRLLRDDVERRCWAVRQAALWCLVIVTAAALLGGMSACRRPPAQVENRERAIITGTIFNLPKGSPVLPETGLALRSIPGISLLDIVNEEVAQRLMDQLSGAENVTIRQTPTLRSIVGRMDRMEIIREFLFPTEFDPPEFDNGVLQSPTTPNTFEMRKVGLIMNVLPVLRGEEMDLRIDLSVTTFEGFANYGKPILGRKMDENGAEVEYVVSENIINQPVFNTIESGFPATLRDGQYLVLGGMETGGDIPKISDKSPPLYQQDPETLNRVRNDSLVFLILQARREGP